MADTPQVYHSNIWQEEPEPDNPFAARVCYCHGYDVYGEILPQASWTEYLFLLFAGERPTPAQARLLDKLALALANPGVRDASVRAAMNSGVSRATHAATLIAALAVGSGQYGGAQEVEICMQLWQECGHDLQQWQARLLEPQPDTQADIWPPFEHAPGFDPNGESCPTPVVQVLDLLARLSDGQALKWLQGQRLQLERHVNAPLALSGVAAAAFVDLGLNRQQAAMLYLMLRLPGAAAHALEQRDFGWRKFPFFGKHIELDNDPGAAAAQGASS